MPTSSLAATRCQRRHRFFQRRLTASARVFLTLPPFLTAAAASAAAVGDWIFHSFLQSNWAPWKMSGIVWDSPENWTRESIQNKFSSRPISTQPTAFNPPADEMNFKSGRIESMVKKVETNRLSFLKSLHLRKKKVYDWYWVTQYYSITQYYWLI